MVTEEEERKIINEVKNLVNSFYVTAREFGYLLSYFMLDTFDKGGIIVVDDPTVTAGVTGDKLIIGAQFWQKLSRTDKVFVLAHESSHLLKGHALKMKVIPRNDTERYLYNIASDVDVNEDLFKFDVTPSSELKNNIVTADSLIRMLSQMKSKYPKIKIPNKEWFQKASAEEIYAYLLSLPSEVKKVIANMIKGREGVTGRDLNKYKKIRKGMNSKGEKIEGEEVGVPETPSDVKKKLKEVEEEVRKAEGYAKSAGYSPPIDVLRKLERAYEPFVDWRRYIKQGVTRLGNLFRTTYLRQSRRFPLLPGHVRYGKPKVYAFVDVSGSISERELMRFLSELYGIVRHVAELHVIAWSSPPREGMSSVVGTITIKRKSEIEKVREFLEKAPTGGTELVPALREYRDKLRYNDQVIVLTDGALADDPKELAFETKAIAERLRQNPIYIYTAVKTENIHPRWIMLFVPPFEI